MSEDANKDQKKPDPTPEPDGGRSVPYERFQKQGRALKGLREQMDQLVTKGLAQKQGDGYVLKLDDVGKAEGEFKAKYEDLQQRYAVDMALATAGFQHPDDRALILERWKSSAGPGASPKPFDEWFEGMQEAHQEGTAPRWFRSMMQDAQPQKKEEAQPQPKSEYQEGKLKPKEEAGKKEEPARKPGNPNNGAKGAGSGQKPTYTLSDLKGMSADEYKAQRSTILAAQRSGSITED